MAEQNKLFQSRLAMVKVVGLSYGASQDVEVTGGISCRVYDVESNLPVKFFGFRPMWRGNTKAKEPK